jgi:hypothetical protein
VSALLYPGGLPQRETSILRGFRVETPPPTPVTFSQTKQIDISTGAVFLLSPPPLWIEREFSVAPAASSQSRAGLDLRGQIRGIFGEGLS